MNYNYHTHTKRCSHAKGEVEEYIKRAIECKVKYMGFSDHAPFKYPDGHEAHFRVPMAEAQAYVDEISSLREKYKDEIDIKIGFEMEYYPKHFKDMLKIATGFGAEYLILGQHFIPDDRPGSFHACKNAPNSDLIKEYVTCVVEGIKSGVFTYVAHPDMIDFKEDEKLFCEEMRKICVASREYNVPVEINCQGIRLERHYPNEKFWKVAGEEQCPVTIGFDAHESEFAYDGESLIKAKELIEKYNLNYIGKPEIINLKGEKL